MHHVKGGLVLFYRQFETGARVWVFIASNPIRRKGELHMEREVSLKWACLVGDIFLLLLDVLLAF